MKRLFMFLTILLRIYSTIGCSDGWIERNFGSNQFCYWVQRASFEVPRKRRRTLRAGRCDGDAQVGAAAKRPATARDRLQSLVASERTSQPLLGASGVALWPGSLCVRELRTRIGRRRRVHIFIAEQFVASDRSALRVRASARL